MNPTTLSVESLWLKSSAEILILENNDDDKQMLSKQTILDAEPDRKRKRGHQMTRRLGGMEGVFIKRHQELEMTRERL